MCFAACEGNNAVIEGLLAKGVSVNLSDYDRRTALHIAAAEGNLSTVELLISANADVTAADRWGHTPMDGAAENSYTDIIAALRTAGGDHGLTPRIREEELDRNPNSRKLGELSNDSTPRNSPRMGATQTELKADAVGLQLCCAAAAGNAEILRRLIADGAHINAVDYDGRVALHVAAAYGHHDLVKDLLDLKADVRHRDNFGNTALSCAVSQQHEEVATVLLKALQEYGGSSGDKKAPVNDIASALPGQVGGFARATSASTMNWMIQEKEVKFGPVISKTLKSAIHMAEWRGIKVVAKTLLKQNWREGTAPEEEGLDIKEVLHEISILSTMRHPDLVMFLGACIYSARPFLISEFMEGGDLDRYYIMKACQRGSPYRPDVSLFLRWSSAVARALCFLHNCSSPIIHRDLKPLNLLLTKNNDLKVTDFGISKLVRPSLADQSEDRAPMMTGGVGTWRYMAPEVVRAEQYTDRADIYSFALIMWFMSTGLQPFMEQFGPDAELVLRDYLKGNEPRPGFSSTSGLLSGSRSTAATLRQLVQDCWYRRADTRPSAQQCVERLAEATIQFEQSSWTARAGKVVGMLR
jgi:serine/threonine protein kinase